MQGYFKELLPYIQKIFPLNNDALKKSTYVNARNELILRGKMLSSSLISKNPYRLLVNGIKDEFYDYQSLRDDEFNDTAWAELCSTF